MKCPECRTAMTRIAGEYHYVECGLDDVHVQIDILTCPECGEEMPEIPAVEGLHLALGLSILESGEALTGKEARFLRKLIGFSGTDFATRFDYRKETVSRWENDHKAVPPIVRQVLEVAMRLYAETGQRFGDYEEPKPKQRAKSQKRLLVRQGNHWEEGLAA